MNHTIRLKTNEDFEIAARWSDQSGNPYTLVAGAMQVREAPDAASPLLTADVTIGGDNYATAVIPWTDIAALQNPPTQAMYDFVVTRADGRVKVLLEGDAIIDTGITR